MTFRQVCERRESKYTAIQKEENFDSRIFMPKIFRIINPTTEF